MQISVTFCILACYALTVGKFSLTKNILDKIHTRDVVKHATIFKSLSQ